METKQDNQDATATLVENDCGTNRCPLSIAILNYQKEIRNGLV